MPEHNTDDINEELTQIREDHLAKNHCGYFKLWRMKLSKGRDNNWGHLPWIKDKLLGVFSSREPCEAFLELIERGPWATYEFHTFDHDADHISGYWQVSVDKKGDLYQNYSINHLSPKWEWGWQKVGLDHESKNDIRGGEKFEGQARTKKRALELAQEAKIEYEDYVRVERPKRPKGCHCGPFCKDLCMSCRKAETESKKKDCGCPNCKGDH